MTEPQTVRARRSTARAGSDGMSPRLIAFAGGLALALVAGFSLGKVIGDPASAPPGRPAGTNPQVGGGAAHNHAGGMAESAPGGASAANSLVGGLAVSAGGYTLVPESTSFAAGVRTTWQFRIDGPDRKPVTNFAIVHDKPMHLVVARRDLSGYQHLHPTMAPDGTWSVDLTLPAAGNWRAYADFATVTTAGAQVAQTLGVDLTVPGDYRPRAFPAVARESAVGGFVVTLEGTPQPGATLPLLFRVLRDGAPVLDLQRYLGSYGHLVVLREGDLGYVHVHPDEQILGGAVKFWLAAPSPGRFRMYFEFQVGEQVRTAEFTLVVR